MANLTTLNAQNRGITNLTGLEWAVNLTSLDLRGNNISSFAPLSGLTNLSQIQTDSTLAVSKTGTGAGTITSSPAGISCGGACALMFTFGTTITLTATPDVNSSFAGWSGACTGTGACQITVNDNKNVTAIFAILPPVATFAASATSGTTPLIATFTDQSQRATSWYWNFGDGSTSNAQNASHVYTTPGTYTVTLTVTNASGSATTQQTITTSACQNQPVRIAETNIFYPSLTSALGAVADGQTIQLQGWNFLESAIISKTVTLDGGYDCGFTSKVGKSILEGEFRISGGSVRMKDVRIAGAALSALPVITVAPPTDSFGSGLVNSASGTHTVTIANSGGANLTLGTITSTNPGEFVITADACSSTALTPGTNCALQVAFAPIAAGARTAALTITSNDPATPAAQIALTGVGINPAITVTTAGAGTGTITSYPAGISCGSACTSAFAPGMVTLSAVADANSLFAGWSGGVCSGTGDCSVMLTTNTQATASFNQLPVTVDFSATPQTGSNPLLVAFTNLSQYASTWQWDFGDGSTSADFNPTHVYRTPGIYSATLTVGNASGSSSTQKTINITACQTLPVRIPETNAYYTSLAAALNAVADYQTIQLQDRTFIEGNAIGKTITLEGGFDCGYSTKTGKTVLKGEYHLNSGTVTMKDIQIVK